MKKFEFISEIRVIVRTVVEAENEKKALEIASIRGVLKNGNHTQHWIIGDAINDISDIQTVKNE